MSVTDKALRVVAEQPASGPAPKPPPLFAADASTAAEAPAQAAFLAELALHGDVIPPLCIGLFGSAGTGKSTLLRATMASAATLAAAAREAGIATPFVGDVAIAAVSLRPGTDPATALMAAVHDGLADRFPGLAGEAGQAHDDPHVAAESARDRLDQLRHRLDGERRRFDELTGRQARLTETVLFESSGSQVDAYARANRGRIDRSLRRFGFGDDTMTAFKHLVRDRAEPGAGAGLGGISAVWAYRGQVRLLGVAVAFLVLFWALGLLIDNQDTLLDAVRGSNERLVPLAAWLSAHTSWLVPARQLAGLAALAAVALNLLRAMRFGQPVARGARLLKGDMEARRRDLDGLVAHQAQRVETLVRDVEQASGIAAQAEDRLARPGPPPRHRGRGPVDQPSPAAAADAFFATVEAALSRAREGQSNKDAPTRLLIGVDGFERLASREAAAALDIMHDLLGRPGMVTIAALDRMHIAKGFAEADPALATAMLDRIVQVPVATSTGIETSTLVQAVLRPQARPAEPAVVPDATLSSLDKPWLPREAAVVEALAPFAGETPRAVKRFVNLYRVGRADPAMQSASPGDYAGLALGLAMQAQGVLPAAFSGSLPPDADFPAARHAAATALGTAIDLTRDNRGLAVARRYAAS